MKINWKRDKQGFTGIQIIIVILLIGIVGGVSYVAINSNREKGKESKEEQVIQNKDIIRERDRNNIERDNNTGSIDSTITNIGDKNSR